MTKIDKIVEVLKEELKDYKNGEVTIKVCNLNDIPVIETEKSYDDNEQVQDKIAVAKSDLGVAYYTFLNKLNEDIKNDPSFEHVSAIAEFLEDVFTANKMPYGVGLMAKKETLADMAESMGLPRELAGVTNNLDEELNHIKGFFLTGEMGETIRDFSNLLNEMLTLDNKKFDVLNEVFEEIARESDLNYYLQVMRR